MNRLAQESSPYLRQHANNPVDWYPWGEAAFATARARQCPIFLSVGYSTCHWCHVMARESFENAEVAAYLNAHFVSVKVDREERLDVDALYMSAVQAISGQGGWPMTVFLTPEGEPFYAGTYFPPRDMAGVPSFMRLLSSVAVAWDTQREKLLRNAALLSEYLREGKPLLPSEDLPEVTRALTNLERFYDSRYGGFGGAPKFPVPATLEFLLGQPRGRVMALHTLRQMTRGGLQDQLGGGFHRYSVDERWLVPHFEKMLYDNAQLARLYLLAHQVTADPLYLEVAERTLDYMQRELLSSQGGFYSAQDADQGGIEGQTYVWTPQEMGEVLGEDAPLACTYWGVGEGNFTDPHRPEFGRRSVLSVTRSVPELAAEFNLSEAEVARRLEMARSKLWRARQHRRQPAVDDKVLTSWNGLALRAFADAARVTGKAAYLEVARRNADFIWRCRDREGGLYHVASAQGGKVAGLLEDQALYGLGLLSLYQASGEEEYLRQARALWEQVKTYWSEAGYFYSTGPQAEALLSRQAEAFDAATLSATAAAALLGLWMGRYFAEPQGETLARRTLLSYAQQMLTAPSGFGGLWQVAALLASPQQEVVMVGSPQERFPFEREAARHFLPFAAFASAQLQPESPDLPPLLHGRLREAPRAYVCAGHVCQLPAKSADTFAKQLERLTPGHQTDAAVAPEALPAADDDAQ